MYLTTYDKRLRIDNNSDNLIDSYLADDLSKSDYYPYGMAMVGRNSNISDYRFGYQGSEMDNEFDGSAGSHYTTYFRQLDPRLGRWMSIDPVTQPWQSPYTSMDCNPIGLNDVLGDNIGSAIKSVVAAIKNGAQKIGDKVKGYDPNADVKTGTGVGADGTIEIYADKPTSGFGGKLKGLLSKGLDFGISLLKGMDDALNLSDYDYTDRRPAITGVHGYENVGGGTTQNVGAKGAAETTSGPNPGSLAAGSESGRSHYELFRLDPKLLYSFAQGMDCIADYLAPLIGGGDAEEVEKSVEIQQNQSSYVPELGEWQSVDSAGYKARKYGGGWIVKDTASGSTDTFLFHPDNEYGQYKR